MDMDKYMSGLTLNATQVSGFPTGNGILMGDNIYNGYKYVNQNKTEEIITQNYPVCFPSTGLTDVAVKVPGDKPILTQEQIKQKGEVRLAFKNLTGRLYKDYKTGKWKMSCNADGVEVL